MGKIRQITIDIKNLPGNALNRQPPVTMLYTKGVEDLGKCKTCGNEPRRPNSAYGVICAEAYRASMAAKTA